jgi:hypothetical protein
VLNAIDQVHPHVVEALGLHIQRQVLWNGQLPVYPVMTTPATNAQWGELMPHWFQPYERPIPIHYLDNWALFAGLYREALDLNASDEQFSPRCLLQVISGSDLLIAFLPSTMGAGHFLRHGALTILLSILWLDQPARDVWLDYHVKAGLHHAVQLPEVDLPSDLDRWLVKVEQSAFLVPEQELVAGESSVEAFLLDKDRYPAYLRLFEVLCVSVSALLAHYGPDWQSWVFQAVNVHYRLPNFGLEVIHEWWAQQSS